MSHISRLETTTKKELCPLTSAHMQHIFGTFKKKCYKHIKNRA